MKSSPYPVLKNRPIDQWKVTELKEELKRRKLVTKGLKDDLIKRLDEALRNERESSNKEEVENGSDDDSQPKDIAVETTPIAKNGNDDSRDNADETTSFAKSGNDDDSQPKDNVDETAPFAENDYDSQSKDNADETSAIANESVVEATKVDEGVDILIKDVEGQADRKVIEVDGVSAQTVDDDSVKVSDINLGQQAGELAHITPAVNDESITDEKSVEMSNPTSEILSKATLVDQGVENEQSVNKNPDSTAQQDSEVVKPSDEEVKHTMSDLNNQVSEISPSLRFPVTNDSVSNDSISINEKNELKDNIIADDVKLESDVKHEMVQPSSGPLADGGKPRPMDVEEPHSEVSFDEIEKTMKDEDKSKKNPSADVGSPEKLNLDRSSGDESMEEDTVENKQIGSKYNSDEVVGRDEKNDMTMGKEETLVDIVDDDRPAGKRDGHGADMLVVPSTEKRKFSDKEAVANIESSKRQRRWKTEGSKDSELQSSSAALSTTPKGVPPTLGSKRNFSRSNSNADDNAPKERVVPPPSKPPTDSLRIDNFLRPFTLKAVQELLSKTGTVTSFWMDQIKTHCYVTYTSVEEATETRNAVYNLQWPPNGGRTLAAEFVDAEEVKSHVEGPALPPPPVAPPAAAVALHQPSPRQLGPRQMQLIQTNLPPPPPLTNPPPVRERLQPSLPPPPERVEPPVVTLDDLFRKTKSTPRIYYLPLSDEQVKAKLEALGGNSKQVLLVGLPTVWLLRSSNMTFPRTSFTCFPEIDFVPNCWTTLCISWMTQISSWYCSIKYRPD